MRMTTAALRESLTSTLIEAGLSDLAANDLAAAAIDADLNGKGGNGISHLADYVSALRRGAINGQARPTLSTAGSVVRIDADRGVSQHAFIVGLEDLLGTAKKNGVAVAAISNSFTTGELGFYARILAQHGLISLVTTNSPALVALGDDGRRVIGTNPLAFGVPEGMLIDQAISETAFQNVRQAAARGEQLPDGWAVDADGNPTTDARAAVDGALRPFGGKKGANLGLILEMLAMLAGGTASLDAPSYTDGSDNPAVGLFILALDPDAFGDDTAERLTRHLRRLGDDFDIYLPGRRRMGLPLPTEIDVDDEVLAQLKQA